MGTTGRPERWGRLVLVAGATFLLVAVIVDGDWLRVVLCLALTTVFGAIVWRSMGEDRRQSRSSALTRS